MIIEVESLHTIEAMLQNANKIEGLEVKKLRKMLVENIFREEKFMMADIEGDKLQGFMFATIEEFDGDNVAFIQACHSEKEGNVQVMLDKLMVWAKRTSLNKIVFMSKRNPEAWKRKYKFNQVYTVLQREI